MALFSLFKGKAQPKRFAAVAAILLVGWLAQQAGFDLSQVLGTNPSPSSDSASGAGSTESSRESSPIDRRERASTGAAQNGYAGSDEGAARIEKAVAARESGFMVTVAGTIKKTLRDDLEGSRHQRFLVELGSGRTVLVAHNIDLADRASIEQGDSVRIRGQYEWNEKGGVLHWTHHDPDGSHPGGWIEANDRRVE